MNVTVLFFAHFKERAGTNRATLELPPGATVSEFKRILAVEFPDLGSLLDRSLISVNQEFAFDEESLPADAEIAVFPPVSGGTPVSGGSGPTVLQVTTAALDLDDLVAQITLPTTGATCLFTGMVRGKTERGEAHETVALEYEAYVPMAEGKLAQVAEEIRMQWPQVEGIAIIQRIGRLEAGTPTVLVACSAAHRDTGVFEAARYGIDRLKEIVPVWKKEIGPQGEIWVEGEYHPGREDRRG